MPPRAHIINLTHRAIPDTAQGDFEEMLYAFLNLQATSEQEGHPISDAVIKAQMRLGAFFTHPTVRKDFLRFAPLIRGKLACEGKGKFLAFTRNIYEIIKFDSCVLNVECERW